MYYLSLLITLPVTVFAVFFAASNSGDVTLKFWPLEGEYIYPLSVVVLSMLGAGFLLGGLLVWLYSRKEVFDGWREKRRADRLEKELDEVQKRHEAAVSSSVIPAKAGIQRS